MNKSPFTDMNASIKKVELEELEKGKTYPVTILMDRYNGAYSGAKWLAFQLDPEDIPEDIGSSDPVEMHFWREHSDSKLPIGKGDSPDEAYMNLIEKLIVYYKNW